MMYYYTWLGFDVRDSINHKIKRLWLKNNHINVIYIYIYIRLLSNVPYIFLSIDSLNFRTFVTKSLILKYTIIIIQPKQKKFYK